MMILKNLKKEVIDNKKITKDILDEAGKKMIFLEILLDILEMMKAKNKPL